MYLADDLRRRGQAWERPVPLGSGHWAWAQPPVLDPLAAAVAFVRSQVWPAVEFPAPVTDPVPDAFVDATEPEAVTAFTANAPATRTARTAISATATIVFTRVHLLRSSSGGPRRWVVIRVFHDGSQISHKLRPDPGPRCYQVPFGHRVPKGI